MQSARKPAPVSSYYLDENFVEVNMKFPDHEVIREAFCTHYVLSKMGFKDDELEFKVMPALRHGGTMHCFCELKAQRLEFLVDCGALVEPIPAFMQSFNQVVMGLRSGDLTKSEFRLALQTSYVWKNVASLARALERAGFAAPRWT